MDGELGKLLARKTEERIGYRILGWFENGFRHISNRLHPLPSAADLRHAHPRAAERNSAAHLRVPGRYAMRMDLTEAIAMIKAGTLDAQENPLANTVTYGVHKFHKFHTLTYAFLYFASRFPRTARRSRPGRTISSAPMQQAVTRSGRLPAQTRVEEERGSRARSSRDAGCEIVELTPKRARRLRRGGAAAHGRWAHDVRRGDVQDGGKGVSHDEPSAAGRIYSLKIRGWNRKCRANICRWRRSSGARTFPPASAKAHELSDYCGLPVDELVAFAPSG